MKVVIYGAGGPVGAAAVISCREHHTLRITDLRPIQEIVAENEPQSPGAPLPPLLDPPHEMRAVDITNLEQVIEAARGMDAIVNVSVLRPDPVLAFHVNMIGAYNVMEAAVECGIRKIIHTGPQLVSNGATYDYHFDHPVPDDAPHHPGTQLYFMTKYLGGEIVRTYAERHDLDVQCHVYCAFRPGDGGEAEDGSGCNPFTTSWEDVGEAFRCGLAADPMPRPYEVFHICADLPHNQYPPTKAERLLGWKAKHRFERLWQRPG